YDPTIASNPALELTMELVENLFAASMVTKLHPELEPSINLYLSTTWGAVADRLDNDPTAVALRAFLVTGLSDRLKSPLRSLTVSEDKKPPLAKAQAALLEVTQPLPKSEIAFPYSASVERAKQVKQSLWPHVVELIKTGLPKDTAPPPVDDKESAA